MIGCILLHVCLRVAVCGCVWLRVFALRPRSFSKASRWRSPSRQFRDAQHYVRALCRCMWWSGVELPFRVCHTKFHEHLATNNRGSMRCITSQRTCHVCLCDVSQTSCDVFGVIKGLLKKNSFSRLQMENRYDHPQPSQGRR